MQDLEGLGQLFGTYFHQDWHLDRMDEWDVVDRFIQDEPRRAQLVPDEVDIVLRTLSTEDELRSLVIDQLGAYYRADWDGGTYRGWLQQIADRVRSAAAGS